LYRRTRDTPGKSELRQIAEACGAGYERTFFGRVMQNQLLLEGRKIDIAKNDLDFDFVSVANL
jgi:hypothetical protein